MPTLDTVCLGKLGTIDQEILVHALPVVALGQAHIDVGRRKIIDMKPNIFVPAILDKLFIYATNQHTGTHALRVMPTIEDV